MKNYYFLFSLMFLSLAVCTHAQPYRQIDRNLNVFYKLNLSNKISFFFNQPTYMPGDTAYFVMRSVNSVDLKPVKKKVIVHLNLVDKTGQKALDQFFIMEDGVASNQIIIPTNLQSGIYRLLCLRTSANNSSKEILYQQDLEIVGAHESSIADTDQSISVFPEGGSMIDGAENKIFVSVHPVGVTSLKILDESDKEIGSFKTNSLGIGAFMIKPKQGETFYLSTTINNKLLKKPLPMAKKSGVCFNTAIVNGKLKITGVATGLDGNPEIILIKNDRVYYAEKIKPTEGNTFRSEVPLGETLSGLFQLWITSGSSVLASRLLYNDPEYESDILKITHPKQVHPRDKIEVLLQKSDSLINGNFSIRIYQKSLFPPSARDIFTSLELFDEIPPTHFEKDLRIDSINNFLATQRWQRYNIDSLAKGEFKPGKLIFDQSYTIVGKCTGIPILTDNQKTLVTLYFENSNFIEEAVLDKNGNFIMNLTRPISLNEKVYYKVDVNETEVTNAQIEIASNDLVLPPVQTRISEKSNLYFNYKNSINSINKSFDYYNNQPKRIKLKFNPKGLEEKSYGVDNVYEFKDYQPLPTMKDILVEILSKAKLKIVKGKNAVRVILEDSESTNPLLAKGDPLFIFDGIPSNNTDFFFSLNPSKVERIKIIWKIERTVLKSFGNNGVIIVETKDGGLPTPVPALNSFTLAGFSSPLKFAIAKQSGDKQTPNFKSCLYWNPTIKFEGNGASKFSFFASDDLGEYLIDIEGLTGDGTPYRYRSSFLIAPDR